MITDKWYSEIPLLRPPKIKTFYPLKTLFAKFQLFFSSFSTPSVHLIRDHLWDCPKVVFKTTFGQSQRWSYYRNFTVFSEATLTGRTIKVVSYLFDNYSVDLFTSGICYHRTYSHGQSYIVTFIIPWQTLMDISFPGKSRLQRELTHNSQKSIEPSAGYT